VGSGGGASAKPKTEQVAEADLLGDLGGGDEADLVRTASLGLNSDLRELVAKPTADIQPVKGRTTGLVLCAIMRSVRGATASPQDIVSSQPSNPM
jgi:hypothetical protein